MVETRKSKLMGATPSVEVYVKLPSGRTIILQMNPTDNIKMVCEKIAEEEGISSDRVNCKYTGKVLNKSHTLGYLGVCPDTVLKAEIIQVKKLSVYVKLPEGKTTPLQIENVSPVRYIQELIETTESVPANRQVLKVGGRTINNLNQRVLDAGITDEATLTLEVREAPVAKATAIPEASGAKNDDSKPDICDEDKEAILGSFEADGKNVEVVFCFDTTGSMYSCLDQVRQKLKETTTRLIQEVANIRIGVMAQGDYCDYSNYVIKYIDLTNDVDRLVEFVNDVPKTGGGDSPECYEWALRKAQNLDWSENSAKAFVMIGDCEPHCVSYTDQHVNWHDELDVLKGMGVKVYGVQAMNNMYVKSFYEELADRTGGAYIQFQNFNIITEMFLAVCYKEASDEQFEAFCKEVTGEGKDDAEDASTSGAAAADADEKKKKDVQAILKQLDEQANKNPEEESDKPKRYVARHWWDPQLDKGPAPLFSYDAQTDAWKPYKSTRRNSTPTSSPSSSRAPIMEPVTLKSGSSGSTKTKAKRSFSLRRKSSATSSQKRSCVVM